MNIDKAYVSEKVEHEHFLEDENKCCLCGTDLKFNHKVDYLALTIKEDAHCPACQIKMKSRDYILQ